MRRPCKIETGVDCTVSVTIESLKEYYANCKNTTKTGAYYYF